MKFRNGVTFIISLATILLCISSDSFASPFFETGNSLVPFMRENEKGMAKDPSVIWVDAFYYIGFVTGVYDATSSLYDPPEKITISQILAIVAKYLKENPEKWNQPASL